MPTYIYSAYYCSQLNFNINLLYRIPHGVKYGSWKEEDLDRTLHALRNEDMALNAVAPTHYVPKATLKTLGWQERICSK
jgi:hypothetical protein